MSNLHSHAFQRGMAGLAEVRGDSTDSFWTWRDTMYRFVDRLDPDALVAIAALAYVEMLEAGFTRVGEFHYLHHDPSGGFYDDPADAEWRMDKESWVKRSTDRRRRVQVFLGPKQGWQDYSERVTGILLEFYDRAKPLDQLDGVSVDTPEGNLYLDFRFEGGAYMTQTNPNRTGIRREVKVYHTEGI